MTCQTPGGEILGIPARIPDDGRLYLHNQRLGKVVLKRPDLADLDYLYYVFLSRDFNDELVASSTGTKIVHTAPSRIEAFRFRLPPLDVQRSIASLLKALDEKIESNRTINVAVETLAAGLFRSWLVDFEPVIAKRDGQRPVGVPAEAIDLFASHFEESELGPIPQGWRPSTIGAEVTVVGGSTPSTNEPRFWNGDVCWVTPRDLSRLDDPVVLDTERHITQEGLEQISSGLLPVGTVLLSSRAPIGYIAIAEVPVAVNQGFIAMKCDKQLSSHFVVNWVQENLNEVLSRAGGTTFAEISKAAFRPIPLVVPPPEVLEVFDQVIAPLHAMRVANVRESRSLAELRATLIGPLVSGDLCFKTAEKAVGAAF
jgi:type I restriction enzyme S subunit